MCRAVSADADCVVIAADGRPFARRGATAGLTGQLVPPAARLSAVGRRPRGAVARPRVFTGCTLECFVNPPPTQV